MTRPVGQKNSSFYFLVLNRFMRQLNAQLDQWDPLQVGFLVNNALIINCDALLHGTGSSFTWSVKQF